MAGEKVRSIGDADFRREVLEAEEAVLVEFTAKWCPPCRALAPTLEAIAGAYAGRLKVTVLDVDDNQHTPQQFGIRSMPTLLFFKKGQIAGQIVGAVPRARLEEAVQRVV